MPLDNWNNDFGSMGPARNQRGNLDETSPVYNAEDPWRRGQDELRPVVGSVGSLNTPKIAFYNIIRPDFPDTVFINNYGPLASRTSLIPAFTPGSGSEFPPGTWNYNPGALGDIMYMKFASKWTSSPSNPSVLVQLPKLRMSCSSPIAFCSCMGGLFVNFTSGDWDPSTLTFNNNPDGYSVSSPVSSTATFYVSAYPGDAASGSTDTSIFDPAAQNYWVRCGGVQRRIAIAAGSTPSTFTMSGTALDIPKIVGKLLYFTTGNLTGVKVVCQSAVDLGSGSLQITANQGAIAADCFFSYGIDYTGLVLGLFSNFQQINAAAPVVPYYGTATLQKIFDSGIDNRPVMVPVGALNTRVVR